MTVSNPLWEFLQLIRGFSTYFRSPKLIKIRLHAFKATVLTIVSVCSDELRLPFGTSTITSCSHTCRGRFCRICTLQDECHPFCMISSFGMFALRVCDEVNFSSFFGSNILCLLCSGVLPFRSIVPTGTRPACLIFQLQAFPPPAWGLHSHPISMLIGRAIMSGYPSEA
jgi:hypothetical protein